MNAVYFYRLAHKLYHYKIPLIPRIIQGIIFLTFNSYVPYTCKIGTGTKFGYGGIGVVVHNRSEIGKNCIISQQVTIGGRSGRYEVPKIGDNVFIGTGAKVLGDVTIGDNVIIGANAVVIKDIPSNSVAAGVPAKIIKEKI